MWKKISVISGVLTLLFIDAASAATINVGICYISPDTLTVPHGEEVIWRVPGGASVQFTVIPTGAQAQVRSISGGDYAATFTTPGEYRYVVYCPRGDKGDTAIPAEVVIR